MVSVLGSWGRGVVAAGLLLLGASGAAQAQTSVFNFVGDCTDCAAAADTTSFEVRATLVLDGYMQGAELTDENFVAFAYSGSNLVNPYQVLVGGVGGAHEFSALSGSIISGGRQEVYLLFGNGLGFGLTLTGAWYTCSPGPGGDTNGSCNLSFNLDVGTAGSFAAAVPEPASLTMALCGLAALAWRRRAAAA